jgi:hypothetical protein
MPLDPSPRDEQPPTEPGGVKGLKAFMSQDFPTPKAIEEQLLTEVFEVSQCSIASGLGSV